jgi:hypothetical protein
VAARLLLFPAAFRQSLWAGYTTIAFGGAMHTLLRIFGLLVLVLGLLFMAQGSGYLPWPKESFMIGDRNWVFYGGAIAAVGFLLIFASR